MSPNGILLAYDTGDGVHANIAGQQAIADYIALRKLGEAGRADTGVSASPQPTVGRDTGPTISGRTPPAAAATPH
ncbi:hypothetical protein [Lentzea sp. E54]|uniref:hypothetical protein n=1 Tax=Lentzea xerophila TaxID=3435883 RepID=UPI003DA26D86